MVRGRWKEGAEEKRERVRKDIKSEGKAGRNNSNIQVNGKSTENWGKIKEIRRKVEVEREK